MSFDSLLREMVDGCEAIGAALMGSDGIPIAQVLASGDSDGSLSEDIATAGVEFGRILEDTRKASDALSGGAVSETIIVLARFTLVFRTIDAETFLVLVLSPDGNLGKARYLIRRRLAAIRQEL